MVPIKDIVLTESQLEILLYILHGSDKREKEMPEVIEAYLLYILHGSDKRFKFVRHIESHLSFTSYMVPIKAGRSSFSKGPVSLYILHGSDKRKNVVYVNDMIIPLHPTWFR